MTAGALLDDLRARGIAVRVEGSTLVVRPRSACRPGDLIALSALKADVMRLLQPRPAPARPPFDLAVARHVVRTRLRIVARAYPAASGLARTAEAAAALARLDAALAAAIEAEDRPALETALDAWARWWLDAIAAWWATLGAPCRRGAGPEEGRRG